MAGRGAVPKVQRRRSQTPARGEWKVVTGTGWQHGRIPEPPPDMRPASEEAWRTWFSAWFAANWTPADLPALRRIAVLYDSVERGHQQRAGELRLWMDTYGLTPKGQQDRRWALPPSDGDAPAGRSGPSANYAHLRPVPDGDPR